MVWKNRRAVMNAQENGSIRNVNQTPCHPNCRACHYAGFSNLCAFFQGGECFYVSFKEAMNRKSSETAIDK